MNDTTTTNDPDLEHAAHVSITIPFLEKLVNHEAIRYSSYWFGGSLVIDMPDFRHNRNHTIFSVQHIEDLEPGDNWLQQYLISKIYVYSKNPECSFYDRAQSNIRIFENT